MKKLAPIFLFILILSCGSEQVNKSLYKKKYISYSEGVASWYGPGFNGRKTASGEVFKMNSLTAAHRTLEFGTMVRVTNLTNNKQVVVRINDRGPVSKSRIIDLSKQAAQMIDMVQAGIVKVKLEIVKIKKNNER